MPVYEFLCHDCGLKFERFYRSVSAGEKEAACPECGRMSPKVPSVAAHKFVHSAGQTRGPLPPNTGTSDDWNYDKAIGRDAEAKWKLIQERRAHKEKVIREARRAGQDVRSMDQLVRTRKQGAGDYRVITETERKEVNKRRALATAVAKAASKQSEKKTR